MLWHNLHEPNLQNANSTIHLFSNVLITPEASIAHTGPEFMSQRLLFVQEFAPTQSGGGAAYTSAIIKQIPKKQKKRSKTN